MVMKGANSPTQDILLEKKNKAPSAADPIHANMAQTISQTNKTSLIKEFI
jgi:hypothetical protein